MFFVENLLKEQKWSFNPGSVFGYLLDIDRFAVPFVLNWILILLYWILILLNWIFILLDWMLILALNIEALRTVRSFQLELFVGIAWSLRCRMIWYHFDLLDAWDDFQRSIPWKHPWFLFLLCFHSFLSLNSDASWIIFPWLIFQFIRIGLRHFSEDPPFDWTFLPLPDG